MREALGQSAHEVEVCVTTCVPAEPTGSTVAGAANPVRAEVVRGRAAEAGQRERCA